MATYNFTVFEVDSTYYTSQDGFVRGTDTLTITDDDTLLHQSAASDPGGDQSFDFASEGAVSTYSVQFLDFSKINSGGPDFEIYAMRVDFTNGSTKYYVMSKDTGFAPDIGDRLTVSSFGMFSNTEYTDIGAITCFLAGTQIATPSGPRCIEDIAIGDPVLTLDHGAQIVRHVTRRDLTPEALARAPQFRPICLHKAVRPLFVSPQHRMLVRLPTGAEALVPAKLLAEEVPHLARVAYGKRKVDYVHLLFDNHEVIMAEGFGAESMYLGHSSVGSLPRAGQQALGLLHPHLMRDLFLSGIVRPADIAQNRVPARPFLTRRAVRKYATTMTLSRNHLQSGALERALI